MNLFQYDRSIYPDRYTEESGWVKVLPVPGRPIQTAEIIEMQSILQSNQARALNTLFRSGSPLSGLVVSKVSTSKEDSTYSISEGSIYIEGLVVKVESSSITLPNKGTHSIGVSLAEKVITELDDPTLRDPMRGGALYGMEGSSRLVWKSSIIANDPLSFPIGLVVNGQISQPSTSILSSLIDQMALHTYERDGNFVAKGLDVVYSSTLVDTNLNTSLNNKLLERDASIDRLRDINIDIDRSTAFLSNLEENLEEGGLPLFLKDLEERIEGVKEEVEAKRSLLVGEQINLSNIVKELSDIETTSSIKDLLTISPGVAYVEGYRVSKDQPTSIHIPKSLGLQKVLGATYLYQDSKNSTSRHIRFGGALNFNQVKGASTSLVIAIEEVPYAEQRIPIRFSLRIDIGMEVSSIEELIDLVVRFLSDRSLSLSNASFSTRSGLDISSPELRQLLSSVISIHKSSSSSFILSSSLENIKVSTFFSNTLLDFDVRDSYLHKASPSSYQMGFRPVSSIDRVLAEREALSRSITRGPVIGGIDSLKEDSVVRVVEVTQGATTFIEGIDYQLVGGHSLDWSIAKEESKEPSLGSTYLVTYIYTEELELDKDYRFIEAEDSIEFIGKRPAYGYTFLVDYTYYLSQAGLVVMDKSGLISYLLGSKSSLPKYPSASDRLLILSKFILKKKGIELYPISNKRWSLKEMNELAKEIRSNSISNSLLRGEMGERQSLPDDLIGTFYEPLINLECLNLSASSISLLPTLLALTVPIREKDIPIRWEGGGRLYRRLEEPAMVCLDFSNQIYISQERRTSYIDIQRESLTANSPMDVYPNISFLNKEVTNVCPIDPLTQGVDKTALIPSSIASLNSLLFSSSYSQVVEGIKEGLPTSALSSLDRNGYIELLTNNQIGKGEIRVRCYSLPSRRDGYKLYFSGSLIDNYITLNQTSKTALGIRSDTEGYIDLAFPIPPATSSGVHNIELKGPGSRSKGRVSIYNNILNQVVLSSNNVWSEVGSEESNYMLPIYYPELSDGDDIDQLTPYEPLLQTFSSERDVYLSSIDIYLESISLSEDIYLVLRSVDKIPQRYILSIARTDRILYSPNGSRATRFYLDKPLYIKAGKEYCIGVNAPKGYSVFNAQVGKKDLLNGSMVGLQPLQKGHLWVSPNGIDLIPKKKHDLTYGLNICSFTTEPVIVQLGTYGNKDAFPSIDALCLNTRDIVPAFSHISYEYKGASDWTPLSPNASIAIETTSSIELRALIHTSKEDISPFLNLEGSTLSLFSYRERGTCISNRREFSTSYHNAYIKLEVYRGVDSSIEVFMSSDGSTWQLMSLKSGSEVMVDAGLSLYTRTYQIEGLPPSTNRRHLYYRIDLSKRPNSNPPIIRNITAYAS
jgi:hypothetical protein